MTWRSLPLAGSTLGCALAGLKTRVIGVRVAPSHVGPFDACTVAVVTTMMRKAQRQIASTYPQVGAHALPAVILRDDWYGAGYGASSSAGDQAMQRAQAAGITLEQTYSAKAFAAFSARCAETSAPLLFWHTYSSRPLPAGLITSERE